MSKKTGPHDRCAALTLRRVREKINACLDDDSYSSTDILAELGEIVSPTDDAAPTICCDRQSVLDEVVAALWDNDGIGSSRDAVITVNALAGKKVTLYQTVCGCGRRFWRCPFCRKCMGHCAHVNPPPSK